MPEKLTTAPISVRPLLSAAISCATSKSACWMRMVAAIAMKRHQPPVIGGKNAISRAPAMAASGLTWAWSIAARITFGFSNA